MDTPKYLTVENVTPREARRMFDKISINFVTGCWIWTASLNGSLYGKVTFRTKRELAHRFMYAWFFGPIPRGCGADIPQIDHAVCDTPRCCNPFHMKLVPQIVNHMRSNSASALNARMTHCKNRHALPDTRNKHGQRVCKICRAAYDRARTDTVARAVEWAKQHREQRREICKAYRDRQRIRHVASPPAP